MAKAIIGISGWNYPAWKRRFYAGVPQRNWLSHCAQHFSGIEVNATFFRFIKPEMFRQWRDATPEGFVFALKGHRFVTHGKKLVAANELVQRMRDSARPLQDRIGVVLWQLPQNLPKDMERLREFADVLNGWPETRHAIEFRNPSWFDDETADFLSDRGLAVCQSDAAEWPLWNKVTTDLVYVRMYGLVEGAPPRDLDHWAGLTCGWLAQGRQVHVYFDNDPQGNAPYDAMSLMDRIKERT